LEFIIEKQQMNDILSIALRSAVVYICIVLFIRIFGKKEISQLSVIDLVFILLISNSVQNAMVGDNTSLQGGLIAAVTLFAINMVLRMLIFKSKKIEKMIEGSPVLLIYEGKVMDEHLKAMKITKEELEATVREHGVLSIKEVNLAMLEVDGNISVLSENYKHKSVRKRKHHKGLTGMA
jgi:uncharacterized membrane protein YcaP (DUF421 family)